MGCNGQPALQPLEKILLVDDLLDASGFDSRFLTLLFVELFEGGDDKLHAFTVFSLLLLGRADASGRCLAFVLRGGCRWSVELLGHFVVTLVLGVATLLVLLVRVFPAAEALLVVHPLHLFLGQLLRFLHRVDVHCIRILGRARL